MATAEVPEITVTLKLTQKEAEDLYFLLINLPHGFAFHDGTRTTLAALADARKQIFGPHS